MTTHRIDVRIPGREYPVLIGHGISQEIGQWLPTTARRAIVVTQKEIPVSLDLPIESKVVTIAQ